MKPEWMPENPCEDCCRKANDPDKSLCHLYAYDIDCVYLAKYQQARATAKAVLEHLIAEHVVFKKDTVIQQMLSDLEAMR